MARCIFENLTPEQARVMAQWYSGQGEQNADDWFEENCSDPSPMAAKIESNDDGDVIVYCKTDSWF